MEFKFIANACGIFKGSTGTKVLCDPWLKNGVFEEAGIIIHLLRQN